MGSIVFREALGSARRAIALHKQLVIAVGLAAVLVTIILCLSLTWETTPTSTSQPYQFAYVPVEKSLNTSLDPCDDFFEFVCGNWASNLHEDHKDETPDVFDVLQDEVNRFKKQIFLDSSNSQKNRFPKLVQNAIQFHKSCVDTILQKKDYSHTLKSFFKDMGGWPFLEGHSWDESKFSLEKAMALAIRNFGYHIFIPVYTTADDENTDNNLLLFGVPEISSSFDLENIVSNQLLHVFIPSLDCNMTYEEIDKELEEVKHFEEKFKEYVKKNHSLSQVDLLFNAKKISIHELQVEIPLFNWLKFIHEMTNHTLHGQNAIKLMEEIKVLDFMALKNFFKLLEGENITKRVIANSMGLILLGNVDLFLPEAIFDYGNIQNISKDDIKYVFTDRCYDEIAKMYSSALDYLFLKNVTNDSQSKELVHRSKAAFKIIVNESTWLDVPTKQQIFLKLDNMFEIVGYPESYANASQYDGFGKLPDLGENVIENEMLSSKFFFDTEILRLRVKNSFENWVLPRPITSVGAYYYLQRNVMVFALSIQNPPLYYKGGPQYLNYGATGYLIGHEINHGFDNVGHERDKRGSLAKTWTDNSLRRFKEKFYCFIEQFNGYTLDDSNKKLDGKKTLGENMADSSGLKQAYVAYKLWTAEHGDENNRRYSPLPQYTPDQMFFISFASVMCTNYPVVYHPSWRHSPKKLRVNGAVSNSDDFSKAFHCPLGSHMNPEKKCSVW